MYDFYGNPPNTKKQLYEWLTSWLTPTPTAQPIKHNGKTFIQESGFRRAFYMHCVFRNLSTA